MLPWRPSSDHGLSSDLSMMRKTRRYATLIAICALAVAAGCGSTTIDPRADTPVSGRVATDTGISLNFPSGWVEVRGGVAPFSKVYRNKEQGLEVRCIETDAKGFAVTTHGDQMKRGLAHDGTVDQSGPVTIDGRPAYRAIVRMKTASGHGVVYGVTILRTGDRLSTLYLATAGDERAGQRAELEALLATVRVQ